MVISLFARQFSSALILTMVFTLSICIFPTFSKAGIPPINNDCIDALAISDGETFFDNEQATDSLPAFTCGSGGSDIWYTYNATCTGAVQVSLCDNTNYDSVVEVIDGADCGNLNTVLDCDDDGCGVVGGPSIALADVVLGQDYLIRVGGFGGAEGSGEINITCIPLPPNDLCSDSTNVFNGINPFSNILATPENPPSTPPFSCTDASKDVWFNYRATCTGNVEFSLCNNTDFDTVMEMFDTGSCNNLVGNELNCDDEGCGGSSVPSVFTQSVVAGKKYLIRVGSWLSADPGMGELEITPKNNCVECMLKQNAHNGVGIFGGTPNKKVQVVWGFKKGNGTLNTTKCAGTALGIKPYQALTKIKMNAQGNKNNGMIFVPPTSADKAYMQMVDLNTCTPGPVVEAILVDDTPIKGCAYQFQIFCPCFNAGNIEGKGIDFLAEELQGPECEGFPPDSVFIGGQREEEGSPDWDVIAEITGPGMNQCSFRDVEFGINIEKTNLTDRELEVCQDIIQNSQMWELNCPD